MSDRTVLELWRQADPSHPFLILEDGTRVTYGEVVDGSLRLAAGMQRRGIVRGEVVCNILSNGVDWFLLAGACSWLGVGMLLMNPRIGIKEAGSLITRAGAVAIFCDGKHRSGAIDETIASVDAAALADVRLIASAGAPLPKSAAVHGADRFTDLAMMLREGEGVDCTGSGKGSDPYILMATSGTTSLPKIVVHIQERVVGHIGEVAGFLGVDAASKLLLALPLCGGFGFTMAATAFAAGATIVMFDAFDPKLVGLAIQSHGATHMMGTNDMLAALLAAQPEAEPFPTLEMYGHANFTPGLDDLPAEAERRGVTMQGLYGLTEALAFVAGQKRDAPLERRAEGGGQLSCRTAKFRVRSLDDDSLVEPGIAGELEVLTPYVMIGYLNDPERTAQAVRGDGYLCTGDIVIERDGKVFDFVSRKGDILRIGGYLVGPAEIEETVRQAGSISACQVVAVPTPAGVRPVAFVIPQSDEPIDEAAIMEKCAAALAVYKRPIAIISVNKMPGTDGPNGMKVKKDVLRDMAIAHLAARQEAAR